jgi:hypothetical protein
MTGDCRSDPVPFSGHPGSPAEVEQQAASLLKAIS